MDYLKWGPAHGDGEKVAWRGGRRTNRPRPLSHSRVGHHKDSRQGDPVLFPLHQVPEALATEGHRRSWGIPLSSIEVKSGRMQNKAVASASPYDDLLDSEAVMDAIIKKRAEMDEEAPLAEKNFRVILRGGSWLYRTRGVEYDSIRAEAVGLEVEQWCVCKGLNKSFTASLQGHGDATAMLLCRAWAARMQFLFDQSAESGRASSSDGGSTHAEDPEVQACYDTSGDAIRKRIAQIRALAPKGK